MIKTKIFSTKAQTLENLNKNIKNALFLPQYYFTISEWKKDKIKILTNIKNKIFFKKIVIRSSSLNEDTEKESKAGNYESILNIDVESKTQVIDAIEKVIKSYLKDEIENPENQILVQPMLGNVIMSGVMFTRDIETGAPYYIINYDVSGSTNSVTSGITNNLRTFTYFKNSKYMPSDEKLQKLIMLGKELEEKTGNDAIDIEFAFTPKGLFLLQARPITAIKKITEIDLDLEIKLKIDEIKKFIKKSNKPFPNLYGERIIYGIMPDWNPAEIIGISPKPLAFSLYKELITDEIWPISRAQMGYKEIGFHPGIASLGGKPYVDVRMSFNTFLPKNINEKLSSKLVNYYTAKLINNPHFHDKIEFEIVFTCSKFNFEKEEKELLENNFSNLEIKQLRNELNKLTDEIINEKYCSIDKELEKLKTLSTRREMIIQSEVSKEVKISQLIYDCKQYGTLPFSKLARLGFIGNILLKSLLEEKIISQNEYDKFFASIETVAGDFLKELNKVKTGELSKYIFLKEFGHLRPGTYDISSNNYKESFDSYIDLKNFKFENINENEKFELNKNTKNKINEIIIKSEFTFNAEILLEFIKKATSAREFAKFEFTKNLNLIFELCEEDMYYNYKINRNDIAYLNIEDIIKHSHSSIPHNYGQILQEEIKKNKIKHLIVQALKLPPLMYLSRNAEYFHMFDNRPNFITKKSICGEIIILNSNDFSNNDIDGKIVLIENADPGFDWIFSHKIIGLITKFGGVASHMSIRSAEFNLPAAIGCGSTIYDYVKNSKKIEMNCATEQIKRIM